MPVQFLAEDFYSLTSLLTATVHANTVQHLPANHVPTTTCTTAGHRCMLNPVKLNLGSVSWGGVFSLLVCAEVQQTLRCYAFNAGKLEMLKLPNGKRAIVKEAKT